MADQKKKGKGGMSKQERRRQQQRGERPPIRRQFTHAGLAPALYTALHDIQRPTTQPLTIHGRQRLEDTIRRIKESIADMEKSLKTARDLLDLFPRPDDEYVRAGIIRLIDTVSASLVEARQRLSRRQMEADADAFQLSWQVAYELQELEVRSHDRWIGRLDQPRQPERPPTRPPRLRSSNVPSPIRPGPSQRPQTVRQLTMDDFVIRNELNEAASSTPPEAVKAEQDIEKVEESSEDDEDIEPITRCIHHRLHRCANNSDLRSLKRRLKKSCAKTCGRKMIPLRKMTLCKPLPLNLKSNLNPQFSQLACEGREEESENEDDVVVLPPIVMQQSPRVVINSNERRVAEEALTEQILHDSTVPLVTLDSTTSSEQVSVSEPLEQLDGVLNADQILNIDEHARYLRTADVLDGTCGDYDGFDTVDSDQDVAGCVLAYPVTGCTFAGVRTPERPWYDTPEPQATPCLCEDYYLHGFCFHRPRITNPDDLGPQYHKW